MDTKFTPGPWEAVKFTVPGHEFWVATIKGGDLKPTEKGEEGRANARLIAAAPDMYEALNDLLAYVDGDISGPAQRDGIIAEARAALAKVKP